MDFPNRLIELLQLLSADSQDTETCRRALNIWNEDIETFWVDPSSHHCSPLSGDGSNVESWKEETLHQISAHLHHQLLHAFLPNLKHKDGDSDEEADNQTRLALQQFQKFPHQTDQTTLADYVRTIKNFLRWFIQIFLPTHQQIQEICKRKHSMVPSLTHRLISCAMLELLVRLLEATIYLRSLAYSQGLHADHYHHQQQELARNASLWLFYATYSPGGETFHASLQYVMEQLQFPTIVLRMLLRSSSVPLALSLVRNLHNLVVSLPNGIQIINSTVIEWEKEERDGSMGLSVQGEDGRLPYSTIRRTVAPWVQQSASEKGIISFPTLFLHMMHWSITSRYPPFPGPLDDKRAELVEELLSTLYAIRIGRQWFRMEPSTDNINANTNNTTNESDNQNNDSEKTTTAILPLQTQVVLALLKLPSTVITNNSHKTTGTTTDLRSYRCQLSTVSFLMDADPSFATVLWDHSAIPSLLQILDRQVSLVVDETRVDDSATAELVPILAVLSKLCHANSGILQQVKEFCFPADAEPDFQEKVHQLRMAPDIKNPGNARNSDNMNNNSSNLKTTPSTPKLNKMNPLNAPKGTLRWKLIRLMTWTEGHVKRFSSEFLWILCHGDPNEFVWRTGLGNAMPTLSLKGFMGQLPVQR